MKYEEFVNYNAGEEKICILSLRIELNDYKEAVNAFVEEAQENGFNCLESSDHEDWGIYEEASGFLEEAQELFGRYADVVLAENNIADTARRHYEDKYPDVDFESEPFCCIDWDRVAEDFETETVFWNSYEYMVIK